MLELVCKDIGGELENWVNILWFGKGDVSGDCNLVWLGVELIGKCGIFLVVFLFFGGVVMK